MCEGVATRRAPISLAPRAPRHPVRRLLNVRAPAATSEGGAMTTTRTSRAGLEAARSRVEGRQAAARDRREKALVAVGVLILVLVVI